MTGSRTGLDGIAVAGEILPPQGAPIAVDLRLEISDGHYKIEDVAINGVSIVLTEGSEIAAQIARDGGQLQTLLATMRGQAGVTKSNHVVVPSKQTKRIVLF